MLSLCRNGAHYATTSGIKLVPLGTQIWWYSGQAEFFKYDPIGLRHKETDERGPIKYKMVRPDDGHRTTVGDNTRSMLDKIVKLLLFLDGPLVVMQFFEDRGSILGGVKEGKQLSFTAASKGCICNGNRCPILKT